MDAMSRTRDDLLNELIQLHDRAILALTSQKRFHYGLTGALWMASIMAAIGWLLALGLLIGRLG